jgi:hypothetical protein
MWVTRTRMLLAAVVVSWPTDGGEDVGLRLRPACHFPQENS